LAASITISLSFECHGTVDNEAKNDQETRSSSYRISDESRFEKPEIWRSILVPAGISLHKFHKILQLVMGWEDYQLY